MLIRSFPLVRNVTPREVRIVRSDTLEPERARVSRSKILRLLHGLTVVASMSTVCVPGMETCRASFLCHLLR